MLAIQTAFEGFSKNANAYVRVLQLRYQLPIMMVHDAGDPGTNPYPRTMRDYRTGGTPWLVIIDPEGRLACNHFHINPDKFITHLRQTLEKASN